VEKRNEGYYILVQFTSTPQTVKEIERRLRVNDVVMKFITVRIDEKLKRIEKRAKQREKRAARKPPPQVAMPAAPEGAPGPGAPAGVMPGAPMPAAPMPASPAPTASEVPVQASETPVAVEEKES